MHKVKLKIAFLTPEYPHPEVNHAAGLGTSIGNLTKALAEQGHSIYVFVYGQKQDLEFKEDGIHFYLIEDKSGFAKWFQYRKHIQRSIQNVIFKENIDVLEVPDWTGISALMKFSVPVIMRFHGSDRYFCYLENRKQKLKNKLFELLAVKAAVAYIAPTAFAGQLSKQLFKISDNKPIATIHYGLQLDNFENDKPKLFKSNTILYIGTIVRKKGVLELPGIFKRVKQEVPNAKLILIGSDAPDILTESPSTWELLKQDFQEEDLKDVQYLGKVPYTEVQTYIKNAHVCVFPTFAETLGMVTIEAMALQKPVVNSNIGWAQELMEDGKSGYLIHPTAHKDYADKIVLLLKDENLCLQIGKAAKQFVEERFDIKKQAYKNIEFYKTVLK
ncbi:glycosyltransferase (GT4) [Formosa agariphila KMM 3901]|uniref:Glycosyltransferase (GT4) n=1 Tax=Formosa agariphila (strain DSM 15362 / KCTC 12365 / LMG 23005 / KMM 3901 / M-2Alg 35-1) TaxID=1347342 RepID=T2KMA6_FORAG|nr:glycosyltransferase family 4 protein [Formosa agariphila]CDF80027.1 glycosyltransferase (GT4) [Formosa agariphila KMM 3901]